MNYKIYGLKLIGDMPIRYIGQTKSELYRRFNTHKCDLRGYNRKINWIRKHKEEIEIVLLEENIPNIEEANKKEKEYILLFKSFGADLLNCTTGGDGNPGHIKSEETRAKLSKAHKGRIITSEQIEKIRQSLKTHFENKKALGISNKTNLEPWNKGKTGVYSEETLEKMRKAKLNGKESK